MRLPTAVTVASVGVAGLLIAGCSTSSSTVPGAARPPAPTAASAVCRAYIGDGGPSALSARIPDAIHSINGQMSSAQLVEMLAINTELERLIAIAPSSMSPHLRTTQLPFQQVADAASTGGELTLSTGGVRDAALPLLTACVDAGYRAGG